MSVGSLGERKSQWCPKWRHPASLPCHQLAQGCWKNNFQHQKEEVRRAETVETGWLHTTAPEPSNAQGQDWAALPTSPRLSVYHPKKGGEGHLREPLQTDDRQADRWWQPAHTTIRRQTGRGCGSRRADAGLDRLEWVVEEDRMLSEKGSTKPGDPLKQMYSQSPETADNWLSSNWSDQGGLREASEHPHRQK